LVLALLVTIALSGSAGLAAPIPSQTSCTVSGEQVDAQTAAAERELVKGAVQSFGLTDEQAASRVDLLTEAEVHTLAGNLESLQTAGDNIQWDTTTVLLVLILVVLIVD